MTQKLWKEIMHENRSRHLGDNLPVDFVSWKNAQVFIEKLHKKTGLKFRLPTEAEWEYAAQLDENDIHVNFVEISPAGFMTLMKNNSLPLVIIDASDQNDFVKSHISKSVNISPNLLKK